MDPLRLSEVEPGARRRIALIVDERELGFGELAARIRAPRQTCILAEPTLDALLEVYAALDARAPFLPLDPRASAAERAALWSRARAAELDPEVAALIATSGTGGAPKLAVLERAALLASARANAENLGWQDDDRWLLCLPYSHVGGLAVITRCLIARRTVIAVPAFDPDRVLDAIVRFRATLLSVVPTMLSDLIERDGDGRLARLRAVLVGGATFSSELRGEAAERGIAAVASYGMTETGSQIAAQRPGEARDPRSLDSGRALVGAEIAFGADGRVRVRGPMRMRGYLGEPRLDPSEFWETGDLGELDDGGRLLIRGRADDVIVSGGENVHPGAVEHAFGADPSVRSVLAFGVPDPRWGERVAVALVLVRDAAIEEVVARASAALSRRERPRAFVRVDALPRAASGKPDRRRAARELASALTLL